MSHTPHFFPFKSFKIFPKITDPGELRNGFWKKISNPTGTPPNIWRYFPEKKKSDRYRKKSGKNFDQKIANMPRSQDTATDINGKFTTKVENLPKHRDKMENEPHTAHKHQQYHHNQMTEMEAGQPRRTSAERHKAAPRKSTKRRPPYFPSGPSAKARSSFIPL